MSRGRYTRLLCSAAAIALVSAGAAHAEDTKFDIQPQSLSTALNAFSEQASLPVLFKTDMARQKQSPGVSGSADPEIALAQLLQGTGLSYRRAGDSFVIVPEGGDPQSGSAAGGGAEVEALIVTAQKREEDIQDVPIAISAFSQDALETHQIAGGPDLITQVPNMTFTKTNFSSYSIQLRGIGTQAISATTDPGVAVAFNNTPFIRNRFFEQEFYDLQRVEVLRGPQGTLYGRNATAGVVNIISQKPKFIAESKLSGDVANYNSTRLEGMVNIPLVEDKVAMRLAGAWTKREGYATNGISGEPIDGRDLWSTRLSLRFSPTDRLDANLIWEHFEEEDDRLRSGKQLCKKHVVTQVGNVTDIPFEQTLPNAGQDNAPWAGVQPTFSQGCLRESLYSPESFQTPNGASVPYYVPLGGIGLPIAFFDPYASQVQSPDLRVIESTVDPKYRAKADLAELQISFDLTDSLTLTSETAYSADFVWSLQDFNRFNTVSGAWETREFFGDFNAAVRTGVLDEDGFFCDPQIGCSDRLVALDLSTSKSRQFSQELRLSSDYDGPFNFSLGANFLRFDGEDKYYVFINSLTMAAARNNGIGTVFSEDYPYVGGVSDNSECLVTGLEPGDPSQNTGYTCVFIETNSIENIQDQGHNYFLSKNPYRLISYAVFGEAYYNITNNLKVTGGLRWTVDKKHAPRIPSWALGGDTVGYPVMEIIDQEWKEPTGRLTIDWKPDLGFTDETLLYASYAHGYKAGGANPPPMAAVGSWDSVTRPKTFDAEFVDAFELGAKNTLLDGAVTLNMAAFYYDYKDYQISEIVDRSAFNRNFDAEIWGLEIEADWRPLENLKLGFKGGYERTRIADGEQAIDLMDRTAGMEGWSVIRPFPTNASNCVLPTWLFTHEGTEDPGGLFGVGAVGGSAWGGCEMAYRINVDPITGAPYVDLSNWTPADGPIQTGQVSTLYHWAPGTYPGWNPLDESQGHNHGEGFLKDLGGNQLPNAPNFTATITADYTLPLPNDWLATLHTDLYWQSESYWRVFDDHEYNKLDEYFTMNLAAIFANEDAGWRVMAYVKNVLDRDSITGAFLNSDDTGLTTNVFLTEPRLYGLRVTKNWTGGPLFGSFGGRSEGPYPFTIELGGQVQRHEAPNADIRPAMMDEFSTGLQPTGLQNRDLDWGDGREARVTWRPDSLWSVAAGMRYGRTNNETARSHLEELGDSACVWLPTNPFGKYEACADPEHPYRDFSIREAYNWSDAASRSQEEHLIAYFEVGRDVGIGLLGEGRSTLSAGLRYAEINSSTSFWMDGVPDWDIQAGVDEAKYEPPPDTHSRFETTRLANREFKGVGPTLSWDASRQLLGNNDVGHLNINWNVTGGVLFGDREVVISGEDTTDTFSGRAGQNELPNDPHTTSFELRRSESVSVPMIDLSLGLSYTIDRLSIGAGYRWEKYQDAIDGGDIEPREEDRTIDGPYFKIAVGFGG